MCKTKKGQKEKIHQNVNNDCFYGRLCILLYLGKRIIMTFVFVSLLFIVSKLCIMNITAFIMKKKLFFKKLGRIFEIYLSRIFISYV